MRQSSIDKTPEVDQLQEVAVYLRQADRFVRKGRYKEALEEIQKAKRCNPKNLYALAYEERVRSMLAQKNIDSSSHSQPAGDEPVEKSQRAITGIQHSAEAAAKQKEEHEQQERDEENIHRLEEKQQVALRKKVYDMLLKAREYSEKKEFDRALDEIARIYMIDPSNDSVAVLESRIRADQDKAMKEEEQERKRQLAEEERHRKELLKAELERIKRDYEKRKRREEETTRNALKEKVKHHLKRVRDFCDGGNPEDALVELGFVVIVDPLNEEAAELEQRIREIEEQQRQRQEEEREMLAKIAREQMKSGELTKREENTADETYTDQAVRVIAGRVKQCLVEENIAKALEEVDSGLKTNPGNEDLSVLRTKIVEAEKSWREVKLLWRNIASTDRTEDNGRADTKIRYKEALLHYYAKLDEVVLNTEIPSEYKHPTGSNGKGGDNSQKFTITQPKDTKKEYEPETIDLEEEISRVYASWRLVTEQVEREERENAVQNHIDRANTMLRDERYDDALAEIAYAKLIDDNRKDLEKLENKIWTAWDENTGVSDKSLTETVVTPAEDFLEEEHTILLQSHIRAAENFIDKRMFARALDEITKAYRIDPLNEEVAKLEARTRNRQGRHGDTDTHTMDYPPAKRVI